MTAPLGPPQRIEPTELPPLSDEQLKQIFPNRQSQAAAKQAADELSAPPSAPTSPISASPLAAGGEERRKEAQRSYEAFVAAEAEKQRTRKAKAPWTPEDYRNAAVFGVSAATSILAPATTLPRMAASQFATTSIADLSMRLMAEEDLADAVKGAAQTGAIYGGSELGAGVAARTVGAGVRLVRDVGSKVHQGYRRWKGKAPFTPTPKIRSTADPFGEFATPEDEEIYRTIIDAGGVPQPAQLIDHMLLRSAHRIAEGSVASSQGMATQTKINEAIISKKVDEVIESMPRISRYQVGSFINNLIKGRLKRLKGIAQAHYEKIDQLFGQGQIIERRVPDYFEFALDQGGNPVIRQTEKVVRELVPKYGVDISEVRKLAVQHLIRLQSGSGYAPELMRRLVNIINKNDIIPYSSAAQLRTELFDMSDQFGVAGTDVLNAVKGTAKSLTGPLSKAIYKAADQLGPEGKALLTQANMIWGQEIRGTLAQKYIAKLAKSQPEDVLDSVISNGKPSEIRAARSLVMAENPAAWEAVQGAFLNKLSYQFRDAATGRINAEGMLTAMKRIAKEDGANLEALFPRSMDKGRQALSGLNKYLTALERLQRPIAGKGFGGVWIQLGQAFALSAVLGAAGAKAGEAFGGTPTSTAGGASLGVATALGTVYFGVPHLLGRAFRNPELVKWMIVGAEHAPGSRRATQAALAVLGILIRDNYLEGDERERAADAVRDLSAELGSQK